MKENKIVTFIWTIFMIIGLIFCIIGAISLVFIFNTDKKEVIGTITQIEYYRDYDGDESHRVMVKYEVDGKVYNTRLNEYSSSYSEGDEIKIYYDEDNPKKISGNLKWLVGAIFIGIGTIFFVIGIIGTTYGINKSKKISRLKMTGTLVYGEYIETILNMSYSVNRRHPYQIICKWINPMDNKTYLLKSENIWVNPEKIIQEKGITTFPIYMNPKNMKQYVIDTEMLTKDIVDLR